MIKLLLLFALVATCVAIHGFGMMLGIGWLRRHKPPRHDQQYELSAMFWTMVRVVCGLLVLHMIHIFLWASCFHWGDCFADFATSFYYSATSYSTVGYGDVSPPGNWRILGAVEAVTGVLMFGWSTGVIFAVFQHLLGKYRHFASGPP